ncbi:hypothetical protein [Amycolatopsis albispora]|uniref:Uncharacterized protein n=1 Tax=Amycolatopsis albispora TaxID=1804986 RepID=A0A344LDC9_9PSEU|nr:hypothetical protein [Amycolatopsis albispora]AXB46053.1 hypothetical protein A4R43_29205 [Amycolatopsis albispora]
MHSQSVPVGLEDDSVRSAVLQAATAPLDEVFDDRVRLEVDQLNRVGPWVFLKGTMHGSDSGRPYYAGTVFEARRADGVMSDVYAVLLRSKESIVDNDARGWHVADYVIGPTDVAWLVWPDKHEAPRSVLGI